MSEPITEFLTAPMFPLWSVLLFALVSYICGARERSAKTRGAA